MDRIESIAEMVDWSARVGIAGRTIALVPTMGFFHEGHLCLMRRAASLADFVVVSLFVNPTQFGPGEDYDRYPRNRERDIALAEKENVTVLFTPAEKEMYPCAHKAKIVVSDLTAVLCGAARPGHFDGVATVVAKLFHIVKPGIAVFGQKDFQQLVVIRKMVEDLDWGIEIIGHPIVREKDGIAMSSRNTYLTPQERAKALCLYKSILHAREWVRSGGTDGQFLRSEIKSKISREPGVEIDYVEIVDCDTLRPRKQIDEKSVLALAVKIGKTRLIDNCHLLEDDESFLCSVTC